MYEFSSSLIRCASAGVKRLHVAGSLRRSYTAAGNVSYTDKFAANARRFAGAVAERCASVGAFPAPAPAPNIDSAGADEFGWLNSDGFSTGGGGVAVAAAAVAGASAAAEGPVVSLGESTVSPFESNESGGRNDVDPWGECPLPLEAAGAWLLCWRPSICAGPDDGMWPSGGSSFVGPAESYELERARVNAGLGGRYASWLYSEPSMGSAMG